MQNLKQRMLKYMDKAEKAVESIEKETDDDKRYALQQCARVYSDLAATCSTAMVAVAKDK